MSDPNGLMRAAEQAFVAGRHAEARPLVERVLRMAPGHPAVLHLYGLVLSGLGDLAGARRALEGARRGLPGDPQVANNLGNLLGKLGEREAALAAYEAAIRAAPGFAPAHLNRAITLDELGRHDAAREAFAALARIVPDDADTLVARASVERNDGAMRAAAALLDAALALAPAHPLARRARARIAADLDEDDAAKRLRAALADAPDDPDLLLGALTAAEDADARHEIMALIVRRLAAAPDWTDGHAALAAARWEEGTRESFAASYEDALAARPRDATLWRHYVDTLGRADAYTEAAAACLRAEAATGDAAFAAGAFGHLSAAGDVDGAEALLKRLPPGAVAPLGRAKHRLRRHDPAGAEPLLAIATAAAPDDIEAWALRGIAWQLLGDDRFAWLNGQDGLIGIGTPPLDDGEIAEIAARLRALHARATVRLGQSVRGGTQTIGNLFDRREPEMARLREAITAAVERHRAGLPPADPTHPILKHRNRGLALAGGWSIRLTGGGFHVQHMHPRGILSAASYWAVPAAAAGDRAGWLEIGGAPAYLGLDVAPLRQIEPAVGRLVLFPSTLHHGTRPFPAGERMSVAFDVMPARG